MENVSQELIGAPFVLKKEKSYYAIYLGEKNGKHKVIYSNKGELVLDYVDLKSISINKRAFSEINIYAKIVSIENSINVFGQTQRKRDVDGSVLRVVDFYYTQDDRKRASVTLLTGREDQVTLAFLLSDIKILTPRIKKINANFLKVGNDVIARIDDKCNLFKKGYISKIIDIIEDKESPKLSLLHLEDKKEN